MPWSSHRRGTLPGPAGGGGYPARSSQGGYPAGGYPARGYSGQVPPRPGQDLTWVPPSRVPPLQPGQDGGGTQLGQHRKYLLQGGWYASCVHAGGLSCFKIKTGPDLGTPPSSQVRTGGGYPIRTT